MFSNSSDPCSILKKVVAVPYYNHFPFNKPPDKPDKMLYYSREFASDGGFAAMCRDDALHPLLKRGSVLILSELKGISELIYGEVYFVETETLGIFRIVRRNMENDGLILQALHPDKYDDIKIDQESIKALYKIHTAITML